MEKASTAKKAALLVPIGTNKKGQALFSVNALANFLGVDLKDLVEDARQLGVELYPVKKPAGNEDILGVTTRGETIGA